jgi:hypothetical protein
MSSCPGDKSAVNTDPNTLNNRAQYTSNLSESNPYYAKCNRKGYYPSYVPVIDYLSVITSTAGTYSLVYISGNNFQPPSIGTTYVNFGNYKKLPITYFSTNSISFVVPIDAIAGDYSVIVINVYNGNFSTAVNNTYPGVLNYSNSVIYTLT